MFKWHLYPVFFRCSDNCTIKKKMLQSSSEDAMKKAVSGVHLKIQANDSEDLDYQAILKELKRSGKWSQIFSFFFFFFIVFNMLWIYRKLLHFSTDNCWINFRFGCIVGVYTNPWPMLQTSTSFPGSSSARPLERERKREACSLVQFF